MLRHCPKSNTLKATRLFSLGKSHFSLKLGAAQAFYSVLLNGRYRIRICDFLPVKEALYR